MCDPGEAPHPRIPDDYVNVEHVREMILNGEFDEAVLKRVAQMKEEWRQIELQGIEGVSEEDLLVEQDYEVEEGED